MNYGWPCRSGIEWYKWYKVYEYKVTRYEPETREGGLFAGYVDTFLKLKAEASGYPAWVRNQAEEELYIE